MSCDVIHVMTWICDVFMSQREWYEYATYSHHEVNDVTWRNNFEIKLKKDEFFSQKTFFNKNCQVTWHHSCRNMNPSIATGRRDVMWHNNLKNNLKNILKIHYGHIWCWFSKSWIGLQINIKLRIKIWDWRSHLQN
jgi:hypothetical protein